MKQHWHYQQKQHHQQIGFWVVTSPVTVIKKNKDGSDEKWFSSVTVKSVQPKNGDKRCNLEPFTPKQRDSAPIWSHCPILVTKSSCNLCQSHKMSIKLHHPATIPAKQGKKTPFAQQSGLRLNVWRTNWRSDSMSRAAPGYWRCCPLPYFARGVCSILLFALHHGVPG